MQDAEVVAAVVPVLRPEAADWTCTTWVDIGVVARPAVVVDTEAVVPWADN